MPICDSKTTVAVIISAVTAERKDEWKIHGNIIFQGL